MKKEKYLRVTMPDGSRYDIPARVIAEDRAKYYVENDSNANYEDELTFALSDDYELKDWAANNMDWVYVKDYAKKVEEVAEVDFHEGWINGDQEIVWY